MPAPIRPNGMPGAMPGEKPKENGYFSLETTMLEGLLPSASIKKDALADDIDADLLFRLWDNSEIIKNSENLENRVHGVPPSFSDSDILRLKAAGLIMGDNNRHIRFTNRAAKVIEAFVLAMPNNFSKKAIEKPYSQILADSKKPKRTSNLALASTMIPMDLSYAFGVKKKAVKNVTGVPPDRRPNSSSKWVWNTRLVKINPDNNTYKEYSVRIYQHPDGTFDVWAYNGRINQGQTAHPKAIGVTYSNALSIAQHQISEKTSSGYDMAHYNFDENGKKFSPISPVVPGTMGEVEKSAPKSKPTTQTPTKKLQPKTPAYEPSPKIDEDILNEIADEFGDEFNTEQEYEGV